MSEHQVFRVYGAAQPTLVVMASGKSLLLKPGTSAACQCRLFHAAITP